MNKTLTKSDLNNQLFRPKRLYITSEDVSDYDDAGMCRFILKEPIIPAEGFKLVYGLASFGYAATAYNISTAQKNNMLCFKLRYRTPAYVRNGTNTGWVPATQQELDCYQNIVIPDGYYPTLDQLFSVLRNPELVQVKSGIKQDVLIQDEYQNKTSDTPQWQLNNPNDLPFIMTWRVTEFGFSLNISLADVYIKNSYTYGAAPLQAYQVNIIPLTLSIIPGGENTYRLYNLLFTNKNEKLAKTVNINTSLPINTVNPPESIDFVLNCPLSYEPGATTPEPTCNPVDDFAFFVLTGDQSRHILGTPFIQNPFDGTHAVIDQPATINTFLIYQNVPFQSYYPPLLAPLYVEVSTNLETQNLTVDGYFANLLVRNFPLNADTGALSFFQMWDNPVMHHARSARNSVDSIKIDFTSENDKWSFFNLSFFIELVFYEVAEEDELPQFSDEIFQIPQDDAMTSQLQQFSKSFSDPFPVHAGNTISGNLHVGSLRSNSHKRRLTSS